MSAKNPTPRTEAAKFMPSNQHPAFNLAQWMVKADEMAQLEIEHAALKAALEKTHTDLKALYHGGRIASLTELDRIAFEITKALALCGK